jgi:hypothetical protein
VLGVSRPTSFTGMVIPPCWKIVPWLHQEESGGIQIVIKPGAGFGDGNHETTQLCLQAISAFAPVVSGVRCRGATSEKNSGLSPSECLFFLFSGQSCIF